MSSEEEKVSRAFLKSVLQAEAADAEEPEAIADPESDRRLAEQLADKYAVDGKAQRWFRRPALFGAITVAASAAAALLIWLPSEPSERTLSSFTLKPKAMDGALGEVPPSSVISLRKSSSWELALEADAAFRGDVTSQAFLYVANTLRPIEIHQQRVGSNVIYQLTADSLPAELRGPVLLQLVTCRSESQPSARRLRAALLANVSATNSESVRLTTGDCQLNAAYLELPERPTTK